MYRRLSIAALLAAAAAPAAASPDFDRSFELTTGWGRVELATRPADPLPPVGSIELEAAPTPRRGSVDVLHVLRFQPRLVERAPYAPGVQVNDHVATALILTGGAAIVTSIIADWLR